MEIYPFILNYIYFILMLYFCQCVVLSNNFAYFLNLPRRRGFFFSFFGEGGGCCCTDGVFFFFFEKQFSN